MRTPFEVACRKDGTVAIHFPDVNMGVIVRVHRLSTHDPRFLQVATIEDWEAAENGEVKAVKTIGFPTNNPTHDHP